MFSAFGEPGGRPFCFYDEDYRPIQCCDHKKAARLLKFYACRQSVGTQLTGACFLLFITVSESQDSIDGPADITIGCCDKK